MDITFIPNYAPQFRVNIFFGTDGREAAQN
jgi:hypothetical protein